MSIHIVGQSTDYKNLNYNNTLYLNSSTDPQIIRLKTELNETFITYENLYNVGVKNTDFVFNNIANNSDLVTLNSDDFNVYTNFNTFNDIDIKSLITTSNDYTFVNSNLYINLHNDNSFIIKDLNKKTILDIDSYNININSNVYINDGVLYVNKISSIGNNELQIENATYTSAVIESMIFKNNLIVDNTLSLTDTDEISIEINKYYKTKDFININKINVNEDGSQSNPIRVLTVNKDGFVGIGVTNPSAAISLSDVSNNIINYNGFLDGDRFYMNQYGNVGIGTNIPKGRLHLKRVDDYIGQHVRNQPLLTLDMNYEEFRNTSNVVKFLNTVYSETIKSDQNDQEIFINTNVYKIPTTYSEDQVNEYIFLTRSIFNDNFDNDMNNYRYFDVSDTNGNNMISINEFNISGIAQLDAGFVINGKFHIPQLNPNIILKELYNTNNDLTSFYSFSTENFNGINYRILTVNLFLCREEIYQTITNNYTDLSFENTYTKIFNATNNPQFGSINGSTFIKIVLGATPLENNNDPNKTIKYITAYGPVVNNKVSTSDYILKVNLYVETYTSPQYTEDTFAYLLDNYKFTVPTVIPAPDMMYITSNNQYLTSISAKGTLSLGSPAPENTNYLLYSPGNCLIDNLEINNIISRNNVPINVDDLYCTSLNSYSSISSNLHSSNLYSSNIYFETMYSDYISFNNDAINYNTKCIINTDTLDNTYRYIQGTQTIKAYERNNGLVITNNSSAKNPSFTIQSQNDIYSPYFVIQNTTRSYFLNINNDRLQLSTDILNDDTGKHFINEGYNSGYRPCVYQHINQDNIFSIGTQGTVNIECKTTEIIPPATYTNHELHTSIGLPYYDDYFVANQNNRNSSVDFFKQKILSSVETPESEEILPEYIRINQQSKQPAKDYLNEYTLNIFGNVRIANTSNHSMINVKDGNIRIADKNNNPIFRIEDGKLYIDCDTHFSKKVYIKNISGIYKEPVLP